MRALLLAAVCLVITAWPGGLAAAEPVALTPEEAQAWARYLVPLPKTLNITHKVELDPAQVAVIPPGGTSVVTDQACKELRQALGRAANAPNPPSPAFTITLVLGGDEAASLASLKNSEQASKITIEPAQNGLRLVALQPRGLYYAVKSLQQLIIPYVKNNTALMPLFEMTDWPDMTDRGLWGCDHFAWLRWMADRKMNIGEQICARSVSSDGKGHSSLKEGREPMITEGPYYGLAPVPVTLHLEQVAGSSGLFTYYPQLKGVGGQDGCICYTNGAFTHVLADWICDLASLQFVEGVDVWMAENLHGQGGCQCTNCKKWDRNVLEAKIIVDAWNEAKVRLGRPDLKLWILTSEETYKSNAAVFASLPSDVRIWYYHSLYTYTTGRLGIISSDVKAVADSGRYAGVCPLLQALCTQPFTSAEFVSYRMNEFVDKKISGLIGYAIPPPLVNFLRFNVEAAAEWSWNAKGRSMHEFALSYGVRRGLQDPEKFAQWSDAIGKVEFDVYGSDWPVSERKNRPGPAARNLLNGTLPALGEAYPGFRGPYGEIKSEKQFDDDIALTTTARYLAVQMGIDEYYYESLHVDGCINALKALYKLKGLVVNGTVSPANRETARYWFGVYINYLQQSIDAIQSWNIAVNGNSDSVGTAVTHLKQCIAGEAGSDNPGMLKVATDLGCAPALGFTLSLPGTYGSVSVNGTTHQLPWSGLFNYGASVKLEAIAGECGQFSGWSCDLAGTTNPVTIPMNAMKTITANFTDGQFTLSLAQAGSCGGKVKVNGVLQSLPWSGQFACKSNVTLEAVGDEGCRFSLWSGDLASSDNPATVLMDAGKSIVANFGNVTTCSLTITGANAKVKVNSMLHMLPYTGVFAYNSTVKLEAIPQSCFQFAGWTGDLGGLINPASITLNRDKSVALNTLAVEPTVAISITKPTDEAYCTRNHNVALVSGTAAATCGSILSVAWSNTAGGGGTCTGTTEWSVAAPLQPGLNTIRITACEAHGKLATDEITINCVEAGPGGKWSGMAMVSLPIIPDTPDPKAVVGFDASNWFAYLPGTGYVGYRNRMTWFDSAGATPGRGFWTRFPKAGATVFPCGSIPVQSRSFTFRLSQGWNIIGQPYIAPVKWDLAAIQVVETGKLPKSLGEAGGVVDDHAWGWDTAQRAYYPVCNSTTTPGARDQLDPWQAFWIKAYRDCDLVLPAP